MRLLYAPLFWLIIVSVSAAAQVPETKIVDGNYIGGHYKANVNNYRVYRSDHKGSGQVVKTVTGLISALSKARKGSVIYLDDYSKFDLTGRRKITIPGGVTLRSGRGINKLRGALIVTDSLNTLPLFVTGGDSVVISGIRFRGPDRYEVNYAEIVRAYGKSIKGLAKLGTEKTRAYSLPNSNAIQVYHKGVVIENCEIYNWSYAGIYVRKKASVSIHHNYIHHNQRQGLGYGISVDGGHALIRANLFDYNRHAVAGSGVAGTSYTASYNIALENSTNQAHIFDMHGGKDRKDGTDIAGDQFNIHDNVFYVKGNPAIRIRGVPKTASKIYNNTIVQVGSSNGASRSVAKVSTEPQEQALKRLIQQTNKKGNIRIYDNKVSRKD